MPDIVDLLSAPDVHIAVVGATDNPAKYGSVIYRDLKRKGYSVVPVNPNRRTVDGDQCYANLSALPIRPHIVSIVVPPEIALGVLQECLHLGFPNVWLQPGADSPAVLSFLQENDFNGSSGKSVGTFWS